ncbi:MAG: hypothetical protein GY835_22630 [bacterium]|nr:hypothetical protein [bacterium]
MPDDDYPWIAIAVLFSELTAHQHRTLRGAPRWDDTGLQPDAHLTRAERHLNEFKRLATLAMRGMPTDIRDLVHQMSHAFARLAYFIERSIGGNTHLLWPDLPESLQNPLGVMVTIFSEHNPTYREYLLNLITPDTQESEESNGEKTKIESESEEEDDLPGPCLEC